MTFRLQISSAAQKDLQLAIQWYDDVRPGLGSDFLHSVEDVFARIAYQPESFTTVHHFYRRALVRRFSFAVFFRIEGHDIKISAIFHTRRAPDLWRSRLSH